MKKTEESPEGVEVPHATKPQKVRFWRQGDPGYSTDVLGFGSSTMHGGGCLVTSLQILAAFLNKAKAATDPGDANKRFKKAKCFVEGSSNLYMAPAAAELGLKLPEQRLTRAPGDPALKALLEKTLADGLVAVVQVSTDADPAGEHFVAAYGMTETDILIADPAIGSVSLPRTTLAKDVSWNGKIKHYRVVSVAPMA